MKKMYLIKNTETRDYLSSINVGYTNKIIPIYFRGLIKFAIHFEEKEQALATIKFIEDVLDSELAEQLEVIELQEEQ